MASTRPGQGLSAARRVPRGMDEAVAAQPISLDAIESARARIAGSVVRPATYELKPAETLGDLIRMAGGFRCLVVLDDSNRRKPLGVITYETLMGQALKAASVAQPGSGAPGDLRPFR